MSISVSINNRLVGEDYPPLIIPEIGINHEGNYDKAIMLIDSAIEAGAEVVKFQCHITEHEMLETDMKPGDISDETLWDIIKRCELTEKEEASIVKYCTQKKVIFLSTPFSREACDRLVRLGAEAFKIGSGDIRERIQALLQIGLIVTECVNNSLKHAFNNNDKQKKIWSFYNGYNAIIRVNSITSIF